MCPFEHPVCTWIGDVNISHNHMAANESIPVRACERLTEKYEFTRRQDHHAETWTQLPSPVTNAARPQIYLVSSPYTARNVHHGHTHTHTLNWCSQVSKRPFSFAAQQNYPTSFLPHLLRELHTRMILGRSNMDALIHSSTQIADIHICVSERLRCHRTIR